MKMNHQVLNLTQHTVTEDQIAHDVIDLATREYCGQPNDRDKINDKQYRAVLALYHAWPEAVWSLADAVRAQFFARLYAKT